MKGLTHFVSGAALASFFPVLMKMSASPRAGMPEAESSFIMLLAGAFGILPDTLDFKVGQYFAKPDVEVDPDPDNPDPQQMAEIIGKAIDRVYETGQPLRVQCHSMKISADQSRQWVLKFDQQAGTVSVVINEIVNFSKTPFMGTAPPDDKRVGVYKLKAKLNDPWGKPNVIDIFSGPMFGFEKVGDAVVPEFLPWHRTWSHSYVLGFLLSLPVLLIAWLAGSSVWYLYGAASFVGFFAHITEDLTGYMGGALWWPVIKGRSKGFHMFSAGNPKANFTVVYTCLFLIFMNMWRFTPIVLNDGSAIPLPFWTVLLWGWVVPMLAFRGCYWLWGTKKRVPWYSVATAEAALTAYHARMRAAEIEEEVEERFAE